MTGRQEYDRQRTLGKYMVNNQTDQGDEREGFEREGYRWRDRRWRD
jgi:hypothetical protein